MATFNRSKGQEDAVLVILKLRVLWSLEYTAVIWKKEVTANFEVLAGAAIVGVEVRPIVKREK